MSDDQDTDAREETEERPDDASAEGDDDKPDKAKDREEAQKELEALEDDPPTDLADWPDGEAKYLTFGGPEGDEGYEESPAANLGPSEVRHHEDGSVTVSGEEVDPDDYKGDPIPGGPTDPNAPELSGEGQGKGGSDADDSGSDTDSESDPGSQNGRQAQDED